MKAHKFLECKPHIMLDNKTLSLFLLKHNNTAPIQQSGGTVVYIRTIMRAKDGHVALEMVKNEISCNTVL